MKNYNKILVVQTAFIGDVILATALLESLHQKFPSAQIDFVLRKGNESLFKEHPFLNKIHIWEKKENKLKNLWRLIKTIRKERYDIAICIQRFLNAGLLAGLSKAQEKVGFAKSPVAFMFDIKCNHKMMAGVHEINRNYELIHHMGPPFVDRLKLYPSLDDFEQVKKHQNQPYLVIAPASVWYTKAFPFDKWVEFLNQVENIKTYIIGAPNDGVLADQMIAESTNKNVENLCGKLSLLQSAALMQGAKMNYVNDSAPQHLASSMDAPTTAIFCSTIPDFGFGPLASNSTIVEVTEKLTCRPCGLHGKKACPEGHFKCGYDIPSEILVDRSK